MHSCQHALKHIKLEYSVTVMSILQDTVKTYLLPIRVVTSLTNIRRDLVWLDVVSVVNQSYHCVYTITSR